MTSPRTLEDRRRHLDTGLAELACDECGGLVRVRKYSDQQTSVQWSVQAVDECREFAVHRALGEPSARVRACERLRESIHRALADGRLSVHVPDGTPVEPAPRGAPPGSAAAGDEAALEQEALALATAHTTAGHASKGVR